MWMCAGALLLLAADVRDDMPDKPCNSYRALLPLFNDADRASKAAKPIENLKKLAEHLDKRYGGNLTARMAKAAQSGDSLRLWTLTMALQSIALCFDEAAENLSNEAAAKEKVRYALSEFAEIEEDMKSKGNDSFEQAVATRRAIMKALYLFGNPSKFAENAQGIRKSLASVYRDAAALTLRNSLRASLKDKKYQAVSELNFKALGDVLKSMGADKHATVEKGIRGDDKAAQAAAATLEAMFPAITGGE